VGNSAHLPDTAYYQSHLR